MDFGTGMDTPADLAAKESAALRNKVVQLQHVNKKICQIALRELFRKCESNGGGALGNGDAKSESDDDDD